MSRAAQLYLAALVGFLVWPINVLLLKVFFRPVPRPLIPSAGAEQCRTRAEERRRFIREQLERYPEGGPLEEILEIPPGLSNDIERRVVEDPFQRLAQRVRLEWQLQSDELLLAERLLDALVVLGKFKGLALPAVHIFPSPSDEFPWKVVIETDLPEQYEDWLPTLREWLAVRVDVAPAKLIRALGHCIEPLGKQGVAGGIIMIPEAKRWYRVTCAHVVAPDCTSVEYRTTPGDYNTPDLALFRDASPCFDELLPLAGCEPATEAQLENLSISKSKVTMKRGQKQRAGYIESRVVGFPIGDRYYRFPHCTIYPLLPRILLSVPFGRKPFSQEGDSGSWVFTDPYGTWIGMLVGGSKDYQFSYVAEAGPLLEYCRGVINRSDPKLDLGRIVTAGYM